MRRFIVFTAAVAIAGCSSATVPGIGEPCSSDTPCAHGLDCEQGVCAVPAGSSGSSGAPTATGSTGATGTTESETSSSSASSASSTTSSSSSATSNTGGTSATTNGSSTAGTSATTSGSSTGSISTTTTTGSAGTSSGTTSGGSDLGRGLFFSEYVEGSSNNKALELTNNTSSDPLDLAQFEVEEYVNGAATPGTPYVLSGSLAAGASMVFCNASISTAAHCDVKASGTGSTVFGFNGNDTLKLVRRSDGAQIDVIGDGTNPASGAWTANGVSTYHATLRRKCTIAQGDATTPASFDPSIEWDAFPQDTFCDLGSSCGATANCVDSGSTGSTGLTGTSSSSSTSGSGSTSGTGSTSGGSTGGSSGGSTGSCGACNTPPSVCYASTGICNSQTSSCTYDYADGVTCDDGNACTTNDQCNTGTCKGTPKACLSPPASSCTDANTAKVYAASGSCSPGTGACSYSYSFVTCVNGCSNGACNGGGWHKLSSNATANLHTIWGTGANDIWAGGDNGTMLHWDGSRWQARSSGVTAPITGIRGNSATDIFAVAVDPNRLEGSLIHYDGTSWSIYGDGGSNNLGAIDTDYGIALAAAGPDNAYVAGAPAIEQATAGKITEVYQDSNNRLETYGYATGWAFSSTDIWFAMAWISEWNNGTLTQPGSASGIYATDYGAIWASSEQAIFVSSSANVLFWNGSTWTVLNTGLNGQVTGVWGTSASRVFASASYDPYQQPSVGYVLSWDGQGWTQETIPASPGLRAIYAAPSGEVFAAGDNGTILEGP